MIKKIIITLATLVLLPIWLPLLLNAFGFYVNIPGWKVAEKLIEEQRNVSGCSKIIFMPWAIFSPPTQEQRWDCIDTYASQTKDPNACELLPPEYGLDCISKIWGPLIDESNCHWFESGSIRCFEGEKLIPRVYKCTESEKDLTDECWHRIAFREKDASKCQLIKNVALNSVCAVRIITWQKYPTLRSKIFFKEDIE